MSTTPESRPPLPPFTAETARQKVRLAEDAWISRDAQRVSLAYTVDTAWRNRAEFPVGRAQVQAFLERKWARELDYRLVKELWAHDDHRIAVRFAYEWHDDAATGSAPTATTTCSIGRTCQVWWRWLARVSSAWNWGRRCTGWAFACGCTAVACVAAARRPCRLA